MKAVLKREGISQEGQATMKLLSEEREKIKCAKK